MEKVFVSGSDGFLAGHVIKELNSRGYMVIPFDNYTDKRQDVRDYKAVETMMDDVDYVCHLAASPYIPWGYDAPQHFFETNANGTLNILQAAIDRDIRIVYWSTSEVYGTSQHPDKPMDENHPLNPHSTYAASKLAGDRLCYTFHKEHDIDVTVMRMFNNYGPGETWPYVIPEIIEQLSKGTTLHLGNINAMRDFTYAEDGARASVDVMECTALSGQAVNVGSGISYSVKYLADLLAEIMRPGERVNILTDENRLRPHDVDKLLCNPGKLEFFTGWRPSVGIREGLEKTVEFFYGNGGKWDYRGKPK